MMRLWLLFTFSFPSISIVAQFPPAADQEGTTAISKDSTIFVNWAKTASVVRGKQHIAVDSFGLVTFGEVDFALNSPDNQTVSLGDGGSVTLTFDPPIRDDEGFDFAVFENGFTTQGGFFLELAFVEVSSNGQDFVRFPAISLTDTAQQLSTFELIDPTKIDNLAGKYVGGYGTPFDLAQLNNHPTLDVQHITHLKLIDVVGSLADSLATFDANGRKINDPFPTPFPSGGFDLDAVGVIHQNTSTSTTALLIENDVKIFPNPLKTTNQLNIEFSQQSPFKTTLELVSTTGKSIYQQTLLEKATTLPFLDIPKGVYWLKISNHAHSIVKPVVFF